MPSLQLTKLATILALLSALPLSSCLLAAAGAGAEAGYIVSQDDRTAGETIDDQRIVSIVKTKMLADPKVSGLAINVDSFKGQVTLKGFVKAQEEADSAIEIARSVDGVKGVNPKLIVE